MLAAWYCDEGAEVAAGDLIACLERDHVAFDIEAESDGVLYRGLAVGEEGRVGDLIAYIVPVTGGETAAAVEVPADIDAAKPAGVREPIPFPAAQQPHADSDAGSGWSATWEQAAGESDRPFAWSSDDPEDPAATGVDDAPAPTPDALAWGLLTPEEVAKPLPVDAAEEGPAVAASPPPAEEIDVAEAVAEGFSFDEPQDPEAAGLGFTWMSQDQPEAVAEAVAAEPVPDEPNTDVSRDEPSFLAALEELEGEEPAGEMPPPHEAWAKAVSFISEQPSIPEPVASHDDGVPEADANESGGDDAHDAGWLTDMAGAAGDDAGAWEDAPAQDEHSPDHGTWEAGQAAAFAEDLVPFAAAPTVRNLRIEADVSDAAGAFGGPAGRSLEDVVARAVAVALADYDGFEGAGDAIQVVVAGEELLEAQDAPAVCRITSFAPYGIHAADAPLADGEAFAFAIGAVREAAAFREKALVPVQMVTVSLAYDATAIGDGDAAGLLARVRELLESPGELMAA